MNNSLTIFEEKNMAAFQTLQTIAEQKKQLESQEKEIKELLLNGMKAFGITAIDNDLVRINYIPESESVSIDTKALLKENPDLYHKIENAFNKRINKKEHIRITVK